MVTNTAVDTQSMQTALANRDSGKSLDRNYYCDVDLFETDLEMIWYKKWIFAGHPMQIPTIGDYYNIIIGDYAIIIARLEDNLVHAFINEDRNNLNEKLCCQLSAEQLSRVVNMKAVHCRDVCQYLYVNLSETPEDLSVFEETIAPYIEPHKLTQLKVAAQSTIVESGNWKLVLENNRECYHCSSNHPELIITFPEDPGLIGSGEVEFGFDEQITDFWKGCDAINIPYEFKVADDSQYRITRMPLVNNFSSYTMHGHDAVKKRIPGLEGKYVGTLLLFHYPNTWNHFLADHVLSFRVLPLDVDRTEVTTTWLVHKDAVEGEDYHLEELQHVWMETNAQDQHLVEQNQLGIQSPDYQPGTYSQVNEGGVIQFIDWYTKTLAKALQQNLSEAQNK